MSIDGWVDKENVIYTYAGIYYSVLKKKKILSYATTWTKLEDIILSEVLSQSQKDQYCMIHLYKVSKVVNLIKAEK